mgnify:CR=1 FL=1
MQFDDGLQLMMVHDDTDRPVMEGAVSSDGLDQGALSEEQQAQNMPEHLWSALADANDIREQRWTVVAADTSRGRDLVRMMQPLIEWRAEEQGAHVEPVFVDPARVRTPELAHRWYKAHYRTEQGGERDLARYQLLLGDLD